MEVHFHPLGEAEARLVLSWQYPLPYDLYNMSPDAAEEQTVRILLDAGNGYYAMLDEADAVVGFCCFGPDARVAGGDYGVWMLDIGLGLRPELTGCGLGLMMADAVLAFAAEAYGPCDLRVTIAEFNVRAQRVWMRSGCELSQRFERAKDGLAFVVLTRPSVLAGCAD